MLLLDEARRRVTARQAAEAYGLTVNSHGKAQCPWHDDKRPSLSFYTAHDGAGRCRCFACNNGGSSVDLAARLLGVSDVEAARALNRDFNLGFKGTNRTEIERRRSRKEERELARRLDRMRFTNYCDRLHEIETKLAEYGPEVLDTPEETKFTDLLKELCWLQDRLDAILGGFYGTYFT